MRNSASPSVPSTGSYSAIENAKNKAQIQKQIKLRLFRCALIIYSLSELLYDWPFMRTQSKNEKKVLGLIYLYFLCALCGFHISIRFLTLPSGHDADNFQPVILFQGNFGPILAPDPG